MEKKPASEELAEERTDRAKERTFAAWLRTRLGTIGIGVALAKPLPSLEPQGLVRPLGLVFVLAGGGIIVLGFRGYHQLFKKPERESFKSTSFWLMGILTCLFAGNHNGHYYHLSGLINGSART
jgi:uncharacterized membrane protein YidH (DUF202 family)